MVQPLRDRGKGGGVKARPLRKNNFFKALKTKQKTVLKTPKLEGVGAVKA